MAWMGIEPGALSPSVMGVACSPGVKASPVLMLLPKVLMASLQAECIWCFTSTCNITALTIMKSVQLAASEGRQQALSSHNVTGGSGRTSDPWIADPMG